MSKRIIKEIFELFTNKLGFYEFSKDEVVDPDSSLERNASLWIMIIMKEFLFSICFILLSSNLKLSIDIFIHLLQIARFSFHSPHKLLDIAHVYQ